jgi:hypothetical protein
MLNVPVTPPRVPLIDPRTGLIDRAWFLFFVSISNTSAFVIDNPDIGPSPESLISSYDAALLTLAQDAATVPAPVDLSAELQALAQEVGTLPPMVQQPVNDNPIIDNGLLSTVAEMQKQIEGLQVQPLTDAAAISAAIAALSTPPVTKTADFTVADNEKWLINNKSGSTCTVTLPAASAWTGRELTFKNLQAQTLVSASSNVAPIDSTTAGTAILLAVVGNWATMVSDGTNWIIMQQAANNCLLLE